MMGWCRLFALFFLVGSIIACAGPSLKFDEFGHYVKDFELAAKEHGRILQVRRLEIEYGLTIPETAVASCYFMPFAAPHITVNRSLWQQIAPACREMYLFHEMGHCVLYQLHSKKLNSGELADSLMNWNMLPCDAYLENRSAYLQELFGRRAMQWR